MIAYVVGSGPIQQKAAERDRPPSSRPTATVQSFMMPGIPNGQYKPIVDEKKES